MLAVLFIAVLAVLTLQYLRTRTVRRHNRSRNRARTLLIVLALSISSGLITAAIGVGDAVRTAARTSIARNAGPIDETVTSTGAPADAARSLPATTTDQLRAGLTADDGVSGVTGAMVQLVAFLDRATHRTTVRGALLGVPITYPPAFGPLTTIQGSAVALSQLGADEVYINQTAAQALGARAGDRLQLLADGHPVAAGPTTLYFAAGDTGAFGGPQATVEETLVIQNATPFPARALLMYLIQDAPPRGISRVIPPHAMLRESVNRDVGPGRRVAVIVSSPVPLTVQRLLRRLDAHGGTIDSTSTPGITMPATTLFFAPVRAGNGVQVDVALANPGTAAAQVSATVTSRSGTSTQSVTVPGRARITLRLDHPVGRLRVTSDRPIVAEQIRYAGAGDGSATTSWSLAAGIPIVSRTDQTNPLTMAGMPVASVYAPVVRAVLRDQNLATGGLLTGGTQAAPTVLLPLPRLQEVFDQPGQVTAVLIANRDDTLASAPLTDQVTSAVQALLANNAAAMAIKLQLILPRGQDALQALLQEPDLAASTRAKLGDVQAELAVPGTSTRLKSLLADSAVSAALRTINDPALTDTLTPALSQISQYSVHPFKQEGLGQAEQVESAAAVNAQAWGQRALVAGILLSALVIALLPAAGRAGDGRRRGVRRLFSWNYLSDLGAVLLGLLLGSTVGAGVAPVAAQVTADQLALPVQVTAATAGVASSPAELVVARLDTLARPSARIGGPGTTTLPPTGTPTATLPPTGTPTVTPMPTNTPSATPMPTSTPALTGTAALTGTVTALSTPTGSAGPATTPSALSAQNSASPGSHRIAINSGGPSVGSFMADRDFQGGLAKHTSATIDTSGVPNAAPQAVYQTYRLGTFTYTVPGLTPGLRYTVRLHFAETYWRAPGKRIFNVAINDSIVLRGFDTYTAAGGADRAIVKDFMATASGRGTIRISFISVVDNAKSCGLELIPQPGNGSGH